MFKNYAKTWNCSIAEAIGDLHQYKTEEELAVLFKEETGTEPTQEDIELMQPYDPEEAYQNFIEHFYG